MAKKISRDHIEQFYAYELNIDTRTIYLGSGHTDENGNEAGVDHLLAENIIKGLHLLETSGENGDKPITIILNCIGGDVYHGLAIYDAIRMCKNHVTIKVVGQACSMACVILQAADHRQVSKNSTIMFHIGQSGYSHNHPSIVKNWVKHEEKLDKLLSSILLEKIKKKQPGMTDKKFTELNNFDTILIAQEALDMGLVDEII